MKTAAALCVMVALMGVGIFGYSAMAKVDMHGGARCLAATVQNSACPESSAISLSEIFFHTSALRTFGGTIGTEISQFLAVLLFVAITFVVVRRNSLPFSFWGAENVFVLFVREVNRISCYAIELFLNWITQRKFAYSREE